ncbi:hypothetical protein CORC01_08272 [Colletotrichum orchidophilum]|uniref:Uncharacterized protein n=1 Tax=Colletotrichum orchidophilum TaxID=1209926 RepID=A0A1G4B501_9PEZI|nr:uncharacterized protein CORC01_08272 [Colletotrichum orchidophilum]OHE96509.1 hypothetical protein CORC01_08272 [Colletotrichum orchidophilum]
MQDTQLAPRAHSDIQCLHFLYFVCFSSSHCAVWKLQAPWTPNLFSLRACWSNPFYSTAYLLMYMFVLTGLMEKLEGIEKWWRG